MPDRTDRQTAHQPDDPRSRWGTLVLWLDRATAEPRSLMRGLADRRVELRIAYSAPAAMAACAHPSVRGVVVIEPSVLTRLPEFRGALAKRRPDLTCWRFFADDRQAVMLCPFADEREAARPPVTLDAALSATAQRSRDLATPRSPRMPGTSRRAPIAPSLTTRDSRRMPTAHNSGTFLSPDELNMLLGQEEADAPTPPRGNREMLP